MCTTNANASDGEKKSSFFWCLGVSREGGGDEAVDHEMHL